MTLSITHGLIAVGIVVAVPAFFFVCFLISWFIERHPKMSCLIGFPVLLAVAFLLGAMV